VALAIAIVKVRLVILLH